MTKYSAATVKKIKGRPCKGVYPEVSRAKLASALGVHISHASGMLSGRTKVSVSVALRMAELIGVSVQELSDTLAREQKRYKWRKRKEQK